MTKRKASTVATVAADDAQSFEARLDGKLEAMRAGRAADGLPEHAELVAALHERISTEAQAIKRASADWYGPRSVADFRQVLDAAGEDWESGSFLLGRLGGKFLLDPELMAVLITVRTRLLQDLGAPTTAERLQVDAAVLSYANLLRVQGWVGTAAIWLEREAFGLQPPHVRVKERQGSSVAAMVDVDLAYRQLGERLVPLLDRANTMLGRNLQQLRRAPKPAAAAAEQPPLRLVVDRSA